MQTIQLVYKDKMKNIIIFSIGLILILLMVSIIYACNSNAYIGCNDPNPEHHYQTTIWSDCINGIQYRNISCSNSCGGLNYLPSTNQTCTSETNISLDDVKTMYNAYFTSYPRVLRFLNDSIYLQANSSPTVSMNCPPYDCDKYGKCNWVYSGCAGSWELTNSNTTLMWNDFWTFLQDAENNKNYDTNYNHLRVLAHSIWLDKNNLVPWKLNDYYDNFLYMVFENRFSIYVPSISPTRTYAYTKNYVEDNPMNTLFALIDSQGFKMHTWSGMPALPAGMSDCGDVIDTLISPYVNGCHCNGAMLESIAVNLNIPVMHIANTAGNNWLMIGHSRLDMPGLGSIVHTDNTYDNGGTWGNASHYSIIPWDYVQNYLVPLQDDPSYSFGVGMNPAYYSFNRNSDRNYSWITGSNITNFTDINNPTINIINVLNGTTINTTSYNINFSLADNIDLKNVSIYLNGIINQSKSISGTTNSSQFILNNLSNGNYTWKLYACDNSSNCLSTINYSFSVNTAKIDNLYPIFYNNSNNNYKLVDGGIAMFSINVNNSNDLVYLHILGINILATNYSNLYLVNYTLINYGNYTYYWLAYGNGTEHNINVSDDFLYTVNKSINDNSYNTPRSGSLISYNDYIENLTSSVNINDGITAELFIPNKNAILKNVSLYLKTTQVHNQTIWLNILNSSNTSQVLSTSGNYSTGNLNEYFNWFNFNMSSYNLIEGKEYIFLVRTDFSYNSILAGYTGQILQNNAFLIYDWNNYTTLSLLHNIYGIESNGDSQTLTINKADSLVYTYLDNLRENKTITDGLPIWLNGTRITGEGNIKLYNEGVLINSGINISNLTNFNTGVYNITSIYEETQNYSSSYETWWVNATVTDAYPQFSNNYVSTSGTNEYHEGWRNFQFGVDVNNTNGTCGIEFIGTNYSLYTTNNVSYVYNFVSLSAGTYNYYYWCYGNGTSNLFNNTQILNYTLNQNTTYVLEITKTTPIDYGTTTDFIGTGCPSQLTCSLNISNGIFSAGTISANYSTAGNTNYSAKSTTATVTINKATRTCSLSTDNGWTRDYDTFNSSTECSVEFAPEDGTMNFTRDGSIISTPDLIGAIGTYDYYCYWSEGVNYSGCGEGRTNTLTINKNSNPCDVLFSTTSPKYYPYPFLAFTNCDSSFILYRDNETILNNSLQELAVGTYTFNVTRNDIDNYTNIFDSEQFTITIISSTNVTGITCKYKKFGYYNDNIKFFKEGGCL